MMLRRHSPPSCSGHAALDLLSLCVRLVVLAGFGLVLYSCISKGTRLTATPPHAVRSFPARGIVQQVVPEQNSLVISHDAIASYMGAMTMPFKVVPAEEMRGMQPGDQISFRL